MNQPISELKYEPLAVEAKWQERWKQQEIWKAEIDPSRPKYYVLDMFPYPSGRIHMGHVRNYTLGDVIARFKRGLGFNVLHPMGWDAFGLPAENAAIKNQVHPEKWTLENIAHMRKQLERLGLGYDWRREVTTCLPEYYRWEQQFFVELFEKGMAYRKGSTVNWCPSCQTVLANEQVEDGRCWRCESETTTRELDQWFLKITDYAEELLKDLDALKGWPERVLSMQRNWIGRSEGAEIEFALDSHPDKLKIFTTRPDTFMGVTFMAIAPEHPLALTLPRSAADRAAVSEFVEKCRKIGKIARTAEDAPKEGVPTGAFAIHPLTSAKIPIFVANFVLMDYGTGALMAVPGHDTRDHAFAKKYNLPIIEVIRPRDPSAAKPISEEAYTEEGILVHSGKFDGLSSSQGKTDITLELERRGAGKFAIQYRMRDWGISRQRYWGAPIPIIHCEKCGPVAVPKEALPVILPKDVHFTGEGGSPLAHHPDFVRTTCPKCASDKARREFDTMDTFMESSWYYLRYLSARENTKPFIAEELKYWLPVDQYIGGIEHAVMHLLYFRFFHKVLRDMGYLPRELSKAALDEPVTNLMNQGIVYKDGAKMSKSKGNVVEPDAIIGKYGADTARVFSLFAAPPEKVLEWSEQGVEGAYRFIGRVWRLVAKYHSLTADVPTYAGTHSEITHEPTRQLRAKTHQTIAKVRSDFESGYHFNTAIAAIMELVNEIYAYNVQLGLEQCRQVLRESLETTLKLLHPFAPHVTEELWQIMNGKDILALQPLPTADEAALVREVITVVVQVNGKHRGNIMVSPSLDKDKVIEMAQEEPKVASHLKDKQIAKTVFVAGKLVNFVVKTPS